MVRAEPRENDLPGPALAARDLCVLPPAWGHLAHLFQHAAALLVRHTAGAHVRLTRVLAVLPDRRGLLVAGVRRPRPLHRLDSGSDRRVRRGHGRDDAVHHFLPVRDVPHLLGPPRAALGAPGHLRLVRPAPRAAATGRRSGFHRRGQRRPSWRAGVRLRLLAARSAAGGGARPGPAAGPAAPALVRGGNPRLSSRGRAARARRLCSSASTRC